MLWVSDQPNHADMAAFFSMPLEKSCAEAIKVFEYARSWEGRN